jgi:HSP20 family protein
MLSPFLDNFFAPEMATHRASELAPRCDILERKDDYVIYAEIPGVSKDQVKVQYENGLLTLSGEKKIHEKHDDERFYKVERTCGSFSRSFRIGDEIESDAINAKCDDGVLAVFLPKAAKGKGRAIDVQVK